jgi:hypothetical protein
MQRKSTSGIGQKELAIAYTDRPVSGWGGLVSVFRFFERLGVRQVLRAALPDGRTLPRRCCSWPPTMPRS